MGAPRGDGQEIQRLEILCWKLWAIPIPPSGTESEAEEVEMRGYRHRRPCRERISFPGIVPPNRVGGNISPPMLGPCMSMHVLMRKAKSPMAPADTSGLETGNRHGHISTRREGGGGGRVSPPSQQMSPLRIAGELGGLPWSKMWIAWNGPNRAYLPLHLCWAMGGCAAQHAERRSWSRRNPTWK